MNTFLDSLKRETNYIETENGATAHKSTLSKVYDMFAFAGAYRDRTDDDCILLFKNALEENTELAMKCLFYIRDIRGGQGERRFFRVCYNWLAKEYPEIARRNLQYIPEYARWDDLYSVLNTPLENDALKLIETQLKEDLINLGAGSNVPVSLLAKWLKSENTHSLESKAIANKIRSYLKLSRKTYRKILSALRTRINIVEKLMSENKWSEIDYGKLPSKAGLMYKNAFMRQDSARYEKYINNKGTKVNAGTLYPYEIVRKVIQNFYNMTETDREVLNKYWDNQEDYLQGKKSKTICVVDTSGSMLGNNNLPISVAISLGLYTAERLNGAFKNHFITFSSRPELIETEGVDFVDKVRRIFRNSIIDNTDLAAVFELILNTILNNNIQENDIPENIVVISDMEIDEGSYWTHSETATEMEIIRQEWKRATIKMPKLIYWNVNARHNIILDGDENVSYVSGCSPVIFKSILTGKTGYELCLETLSNDRYAVIK